MTQQYSHIVEIGVGDSYSSQAVPLVCFADKVTLYEPNRLFWKELNHVTSVIDKVTVHPMAVGLAADVSLLYHLGYASYLKGAPSFYGMGIEPEGVPFIEPLALAVDVMSANEAVQPDVDLLIVTTNGGESRILASMAARPREIRTKHYMHNAPQSEDAQRTWEWLGRNGYSARIVEANQHRTFLHLHWAKA